VKITVRLYGALRRYSSAAGGDKHRPFTVVAQPEATVEELLQQLGIDTGVVSAVAVNGEHAPLTVALHDGDEVYLFPPVAGG
jgi:molybdopterin converting factor small subunit